ncbi:hypothetical protein K504DRAFT_452138 [Pleomassaria siparia CBS 279.74]|uniref:DUF8021 domain-containing protein n=1 Tax=Pleomassaria siparia CBS 279.74 TaxID=1314801 RepID=A0A6G1JQG7_9PLEO|nr:hypothetical protein K504DRAFT_452138 [Pleomassaria siparia CBS 279.74]
MLFPTVFASLAIAVSATQCNREFLKYTTSNYVLAQRGGVVAGVSGYTSPDLIYTENGKTLDINKGSVLSQAIDYDYTFSVHDIVRCTTFTEIIAASTPHPYVIHTRMEFNATASDGLPAATLIESIVTDAGDWLFNATGTLDLAKPEKWAPIPAAQQDTRAVVQSIGDAYFNRFGDSSITVPWAAPCYRLEGGIAVKGTMHNDTGVCEMVWPTAVYIPYRRYVVDEELGVVDLFIGFPGLDSTQGNNSMPDSHLFRVEGGKIKYVHTASACVADGCGFNGTFGR